MNGNMVRIVSEWYYGMNGIRMVLWYEWYRNGIIVSEGHYGINGIMV